MSVIWIAVIYTIIIYLLNRAHNRDLKAADSLLTKAKEDRVVRLLALERANSQIDELKLELATYKSTLEMVENSIEAAAAYLYTDEGGKLHEISFKQLPDGTYKLIIKYADDIEDTTHIAKTATETWLLTFPPIKLVPIESTEDNAENFIYSDI